MWYVARMLAFLYYHLRLYVQSHCCLLPISMALNEYVRRHHEILDLGGHEM